MSLNQNIRFGQPDTSGTNFTNPGNLYDFAQVSRIIVLPTDPVQTDGFNYWYAINSNSGQFFFKDPSLGWDLLPFTFNGGGGGTLTNLQNEGTGTGDIFDSLTGTVALIRRLNSPTGKVVINTVGQSIELGVALTSADVGLNNVQNILSNLNSGRDPTAADDSSPGHGYSIGSTWNNIAGGNSRFFVCASAALNTAVWTLIGPGTGTTSLANIGTGQNIYVTGSSNPSQIRSLISSTNKVSIINTGDELNLGVMNLTKADVGLNNVQNILNNYTSVVDPTVNDAGPPYSIGSIWFNQSPSVKMFVCRNTTPGSAIWDQIGPTFKDLGSFGFLAPATTGPMNSNTVTPLRGEWIVSPVNFIRPIGGSPNLYWGITSSGSPPLYNITRLKPSNSLGGTNYYQVEYSFIVTAGGVGSTTQLSLNWNSSGNCQVGLSNSVLVIPLDGTSQGTLSGSFVVASFDNAAFSLFVEIQTTVGLVGVTVQYAACNITQL